MWNSKKIFCLLLAAIFCAGKVPICAEDTGYRTTTVTRGTITAEATVPASYHYTSSLPIEVNFGCGSVKFVQYATKSGEYVSEGDVIAYITTGVDEITLEEIKLRMQRAEESREEAYAKMEEAYRAAQEAVGKSSGTQKKIAELRLEQLGMEQERQKRAVEENFAVIKEQYDTYQNVLETKEIVAPKFGLITQLNYYSPGALIPDGASIGTLLISDEAMFSVADIGSVLRYGMPVKLIDGMGEEYQCRVVSCGEKYLSGSFKVENAYLKPDYESTWGFNARYENLHIDNALLVDNAAVYTDKDGTYVVELKDGKLSKCYFTVGKTTKDLCYALDGLTEGMVVVIQ